MGSKEASDWMLSGAMLDSKLAYQSYSDAGDCRWYIICTKRHKEALVKNLVSSIVDDIYLPLMSSKSRYLRTTVDHVGPLFPGYIFALFDAANLLYKLKHCHGVAGIVCAGGEPCVVDISIIKQIRNREKNGVITLNPPRMQSQQRVNILHGPFHGIEAVFERYLRGPERVAVLLNTVGGGSVRIIVPAAALAPADSPESHS